MADRDAEQDDLFDESDNDGDEDQKSDSQGEASAPSDDSQANADAADGKEEKRLNDLMSKWQKAESENKRLKSQLASQKAPQSEGAQDGAESAQENEFTEFAREHVRGLIFGQDSRLKDYGLDAGAINGSTVAEMRASFQQQVKLIEGLEARARNRVQSELGLDPSIGDTSGEEFPDFGRMSKKEYEEWSAEHGVPL